MNFNDIMKAKKNFSEYFMKTGLGQVYFRSA